MRKFSVCILLATVLVAHSRFATAADPPRTAAQIFPDSAVVYAEVTDPKQLIAAIYDHPIAKKLQEDERYKPILNNPEIGKFRLGVGWVELAMMMSWRNAAEMLTEGGVFLCVDGGTGGVVTLVRARDAASLNRMRDLFLKLARDDAKNKSQNDPVKSAEYRGVTAYRAGDVRFATYDAWLVLTQNDELGKATIDRLLDGGKSLADDAQFQEIRAKQKGSPAAWAYVRIDKLRDAGQAAALAKGSTDNAAAELLVGGVVGVLKKTTHVTASFDIADDRAQLTLAAPFQADWIPAERTFYFGEKAQGAAPRPIMPRDTLLSLTAFRDLAALWNSAPDLFDEKVNAELNQANSGLSTLFSGRDFGQDVLGSIGPQWQLVVARQKFGEGPMVPDIRLPAFGFVFELRDPETSQRDWKVTFQSLIGFLNVVGSMQGQPPLDQETRKIDGGQMVVASYPPPREGRQPAARAIHYNFSPSLALVGSRLIIASTQELTDELASGVTKSSPAETTPRDNGESVNTALKVDLAPLRAGLADNREHLVTRNMLDKGHDRSAAEQEIDTLLRIVELVRDVEMKLTTEDGQLKFTSRLGLVDK